MYMRRWLESALRSNSGDYRGKIIILKQDMNLTFRVLRVAANVGARKASCKGTRSLNGRTYRNIISIVLTALKWKLISVT